MLFHNNICTSLKPIRKTKVEIHKIYSKSKRTAVNHFELTHDRDHNCIPNDQFPSLSMLKLSASYNKLWNSQWSSVYEHLALKLEYCHTCAAVMRLCPVTLGTVPSQNHVSSYTQRALHNWVTCCHLIRQRSELLYRRNMTSCCLSPLCWTEWNTWVYTVMWFHLHGES